MISMVKVLLDGVLVVVACSFASLNALSIFNNTLTPDCPSFDDIANGETHLITTNGAQKVHVECKSGYDLFGPSKILCVEGAWKLDQLPKCVCRCPPPTSIRNGDVDVDDTPGNDGRYAKGTMATYFCHEGYQLQPPEGQYRVCEKGIWTGTNVTCVLIDQTNICKPLLDIANGYFLIERVADQFIGRYYCKRGFKLRGQSEHRCQEDGTWSYKPLPQCLPILSDESGCALPDSYPHATSQIVAGTRISDVVIAGTEVEYICTSKYRNANDPCKPSRLRCVEGRWLGMPPSCELASECGCVPTVPSATPIVDSFFDVVIKPCHYPIHTQVRYACRANYELRGNPVLNCSTSGCWTPIDLPFCKLEQHRYYFDPTGEEPIILSLSTGAAVLLVLVIVCLVIVCRKRKPLTRTVTMPPPMPRADLSDHASLLHHPPDRLALIAFADGVQSLCLQSGLPTYEEATRERGGGFGVTTSARLQRPPWPSLAGRRSRNSPNPENIHFGRQASCMSRSGGDPMGSTDTMAVSENSTTVTLDTASSHSGSQPASCRAHCGSLASFDTSSVLNTEGVPLLEESELEEINCCETVSLAMENRSMCDNSSFKLSTASDLA